MPSKTLVLGLGNAVLTDDAAGMLVADIVEDALPPGSGIDVWTSSHGGLKLVELMAGYHRVILIDATHRPDGQPGTFRRLSPDDVRSLAPLPHAASAHNTDLLGALHLGQRMGLPMPEEIVIFLIDALDVTAFGEEPTPAVAAAIPHAAEAVLEELGVPGTSDRESGVRGQ